jgi:hypothetical protein
MQENHLIYEERLTSNRTEALFVGLTMLFLVLFFWRVSTTDRQDFLAITFLGFFGFFLFYAINYRTLTIHLTRRDLKLTFGLISWSVPVDNIQACRIDDVPVFQRLGGAGIHFMFVRKRYRASFNFLEYPRVVVELKRKAGMVDAISFSTRRPHEVLQLLRGAGVAVPAA